MTKFLFIILILFYFNGSTLAQKDSSYSLFGKTNIQTAKAFLIPIADITYYAYHVEVLETEVTNGEFQFKGKMTHPGAFMLQIKNSSNELIYVSQMFFLDPGTQEIKCNIKIVRENPVVLNSTSQDYEKLKVQFDQIENKIEELYKRETKEKQKFENDLPIEIHSDFSREFKNIVNKKDTILFRYTKGHPNSFVTLWNLVTRVNSGYKPIYDSIYDLLSFQLKETVTGTRLKKELHSSARLNIGNKFPHLTLLDLKNKPVEISIDSSKKYTLIDFWFSSCSPCISQFETLKKTFYKHHKKFDIIAISVDAKERVGEWKEVIAKYQLPWTQYLDLNEKEAKLLSINSYPTNFLLDSKGRILESNIGMEELQLLLEK